MSKIIINASKSRLSITAEGAASLILGGGIVTIGIFVAYKFLI